MGIVLWRPVLGFESLYEVSNKGDIKSLNRVVNHPKSGKLTLKGKLIRQQDNGRGYKQVTLYKEGNKYCKRVNRLVAESFLPNPEKLTQVAHLDETRWNNSLSNLKWVTPKENANFPKFKKRISKSNKNGKLSKRVIQKDLEKNIIKVWDSVSECGRNGFNQGNVSSCCRGEKQKYKNYYWSYE